MLYLPHVIVVINVCLLTGYKIIILILNNIKLSRTTQKYLVTPTTLPQGHYYQN